MTEYIHPRFQAKSGKAAPITVQRGHKPILMWDLIASPSAGLIQADQGTRTTALGVGVDPEPVASWPSNFYRQVLEGVRVVAAGHVGKSSFHFHAEITLREHMNSLKAQVQNHQHGVYGRRPCLIQHSRGLLTEVMDDIGCARALYSSGLSPRNYAAFFSHLTQGVLPLSGKEEISIDLFGHPALTGNPIVAPSPPLQPTVADRLATLLAKLQDLSKKRQEFDEKIVADIDALLDEQPTARTALLDVARGEPVPGGRPAWAPRVRWFAIEQLRHWPLPEADAAEFLPPPSYLGTLIEAIETWGEDEALYGAVVNARLVKVNATQRAKLRDALIKRLSSKTDSLERTMGVLEAQLLGQMLCTFGSFARADDLEVIGHFALADSAFAVRTHALEALRRVVCREPDALATNAFFDACANRFVELCNSCLQLRRSSEPNGTLLWSAISVLLGRFGKEALVVANLARLHPKLRRDIALEIDRAVEYLRRVGQARRLETQTEVRHQLADSVADVAPAA